MPSNPSRTISPLGFSQRPPPAFRCSWRDGGRAGAWVHVVGELDIATTPEFDVTMRAAEQDAALIVVDLRDLEFIASSAIRVVMETAARARENGGRLVLLRTPSDVHRMFVLAGATDDLEMVEVAPPS